MDCDIKVVNKVLVMQALGHKFDPSSHMKAGSGYSVKCCYSRVEGERDRWISGAYWPASLAKPMSSSLS